MKNFFLSKQIISDITSMTSYVMGERGKTKEQKKIVRYFRCTGFWGMFFRISHSVFDSLLDRKAEEVTSQIAKRALEAHGMDVDEVKEIPPIFVEDYYLGSPYFKWFRDNTFRASKYQMSYLMFSEKQIYAYSYIFDMASADTDEQTKEFFYEDITSIDIVKTQRDRLAPRPLEYIIGGIACLIIGFLLILYGFSESMSLLGFIGFLVLIAGVILTWFRGFSRRLVDGLSLRVTVPGDEFVCAVNPDNIEAIQGMKAKIREKKK